ncbi:MAG: DoxX family protein [Candidatus Spechtbacteria bacterium]|nr:DoxX family protein [Candidatus Spechtbacteria bacterium]
MLEQLIQFNNFGLFLLRLVISVIFLYHAFPKLKNAKGMATAMGAPTIAVFMLGSVEFLASLGLIFGMYTQIAALVLAIVMVGAIVMKIMQWHVPFSAMDKTGWEFDFILLAANIAIILSGGGSIKLW